MKEAQHRLQAALEHSHWWHRGKRRILRCLLEALVPPRTGRRVVEIGCGVGGNLGALAGDYVCAGFDSSTEALGWARAHFPHVRFQQGDSPAVINDELGRAEAVLLLDVLEHIDDDKGFLADVIGRVSPGTFILITVPADPSLWSVHDESLGHRRRYTFDTGRALWADQPVVPLLVSSYNARLYPLAWVARKLSKLRGRSWGGAGTDVGSLPRPMGVVLEWIFGGEAAALRRGLLTGRTAYMRGLSLIAVLKKMGPL